MKTRSVYHPKRCNISNCTMTYAGIPSLISLDLSNHLHDENSSLQRWLAGSFLGHLVVVLLILSLRFSPTIEQPLTAYEVSLVSLPATNAPTRENLEAKTAKNSSEPVQTTATPPTKPVPPPPKPQEKPLPPLATKMASERLSESFLGAAKSVVVPDKLAPQAQGEPPPVVRTTPPRPTALQNIKLPSEAPTLKPVEPLAPAESVKIPDATIEKPVIPSSSPAVSRKTVPSSKANIQDTVKGIKIPPQAPALAAVQPFTKTDEDTSSPSTPEPLSQSLKEKIQSVQLPALPQKPIRESHKRPKPTTPITPPPTPTVPQTPELAKAAPPTKVEAPPAIPRERLSESLKEVLESVKVPQLRDVTKTDPVRIPDSELPSPEPIISHRDAAASKQFRAEIDQQLAKLKVPDVAPIESIRTRLQIQETLPANLELDQSGPTGSTSRNTQGQNQYLALVQSRIDQQWVAPPVKADEKHLQVVLRFRILRSGKVIDLNIERGSGNHYYDAAALRAVQSANPLPPFPSDIHNFSFDVRYNFILGEPSS